MAGVSIIDNGREDRILDICRKFGKRVSYTANPNTGYGAAHNIAMRRTLGSGIPYHLVINSDVYFDPAILADLVEYMDANKNIGQLIPRTVYPDGSYQPVCHPLPSVWNLICRRFTPGNWFRSQKDRYDLRGYDLSVPRDIPYHHGCFMLLRCEALKQVGLFDERYFMYPEDIDLTRRVHECWQTIYYPYAEIVHAHRAESRVNMRMLRIHAVNMLRYFRKWGFIFDSKRKKANRRLWDSLSAK